MTGAVCAQCRLADMGGRPTGELRARWAEPQIDLSSFAAPRSNFLALSMGLALARGSPFCLLNGNRIPAFDRQAVAPGAMV
jgi:hypothetical protein